MQTGTPTMNTPHPTRRRLLQGCAGLAAGIALPSLAQTEPDAFRGPVRIVIPLSAGGAADAQTRPLALQLQSTLKQTVIVDNKPGGLFMIGLQSVLQAPADGHTLFYLYNSVASVQAVHKKFEINRQLVPVTQTTAMPMVLLVPGNSRFGTLADLLAFGRANPGKLNYGSLGLGSTEHLKAVQLERAAELQAVNVPFRSGPEMVKGLIGGEVDFTLTASTFAHTFAPKGHVRVLAVIDRERMHEMPDVPTIAQVGVDIPPLVFWGGYAVRAGTPPAIVERLHAELSAAATHPAVRSALAPLGIVPATSRTPRAFSQLIADDVTWMADIAKDLNIAPDKS
jgi:tripartite-type tricarboxylate transporter receptor subunit TctC